jgi:hypothetical protein
MAGWYDTRVITIGASDVVIATNYPGLLCGAIRNEAGTVSQVFYSTLVNPLLADKKDINLPAYGYSDIMPPIGTVWGTGNGSTAAKITLYFHKL